MEAEEIGNAETKTRTPNFTIQISNHLVDVIRTKETKTRAKMKHQGYSRSEGPQAHAQLKVASYSAAAKLPAAKSEKTAVAAQQQPIFDVSSYLKFQWLNHFRQKVCGVAQLYAVGGCGVLYVDCRFLILYNQNLDSQIVRGWANPSNEFNPHTNSILHHLPTRSLLVVHKG
uniref:Uncharacterized protein n=1 Tax=Romanomermis culicivorax TaxID=13658 RepID=A0A915HV32_ROMCU